MLKSKSLEEENKDKIKLFYLPPYSPEFNPDEYLNQDYKSNVQKMVCQRKKKKKIRKIIWSLQKIHKKLQISFYILV